ncbi:lytic transglycosylase domain-containing protein [Aestuariivita boseongensis]|uniref:lytic transglycosylase domain-containing protein n=1 Tax=Aestuariivita boseongensis TaxID=1470562 RepID=UPI0009E1F002|nr:lytic transglycosylase domain-containing protein [Aestuariivita boseongensis]
MVRYLSALVFGVSLGIALPGLGFAQALNGGSFEAKRVKPPAPGTTKRITVQVPPRANPAVPPLPERPVEEVTAVLPAVPDGAAVGRYAWFWDKISPSLTESGPGRLDAAIQTLRGAAEQVKAPRLQHLQDIARSHGVDILTSTIGTQVSPALVLAVISVESAGKADAVSSAGATGLMQLMPATAERFGVSDSTIATQNIAGGVKYLDWLMKEFARDPILVLAGYNAGEGSVRDHAGVPPYAETRDYVPKVLAAFEVAKGLCLTPPELISDGCVFAAMN